ncbi:MULTISPECIES: hypothetical protein [unclassified Crossiella]|uniref:hypothetical protein n=1 Tax=unclassified Crossiella TaxID=2620835 RepID=UPI001FFE3663|nr:MULTISPECIES: hypothetical protein [unclassified Crossiella]MCK2240033.1 hypothetical protein [Crossiella sp. S99.2]MCK2252741.1 hypothetical protein [Crossiella sp. S99.1]
MYQYFRNIEEPADVAAATRFRAWRALAYMPDHVLTPEFLDFLITRVGAESHWVTRPSRLFFSQPGSAWTAGSSTVNVNSYTRDHPNGADTIEVHSRSDGSVVELKLNGTSIQWAKLCALLARDSTPIYKHPLSEPS